MIGHRAIATILVAACLSLSGFGQGLRLTLELARDEFLLGEPIEAKIRIDNLSDEDWVTDTTAFDDEHLAYALRAEREAPDGWTLILTDLLRTTPPPPPLLAMRDGEVLAAGYAFTIAPGATETLRVSNLLSLMPLVEPGTYRLGLRIEIARYPQTLDVEGKTIAFADAVFTEFETAEAASFRIAIPDGVMAEDVQAFADLRSVYNANADSFLTQAQTILDGFPSEHMRAAALFWIGEMQAKLGNLTEAASAYASVAADYPSSVFAAPAANRLSEIAPQS